MVEENVVDKASRFESKRAKTSNCVSGGGWVFVTAVNVILEQTVFHHELAAEGVLDHTGKGHGITNEIVSEHAILERNNLFYFLLCALIFETTIRKNGAARFVFFPLHKHRRTVSVRLQSHKNDVQQSINERDDVSFPESSLKIDVLLFVALLITYLECTTRECDVTSRL